MNVTSKLVSAVFHPLLIATYLFALLSLTLPSALEPIPFGGHKSFLLLILTVTFLLPALNLTIFKVLGSVPTLTMENRKERIIPFILITIFYGVITYLFSARYHVSTDDNVFKLILILYALVMITTVITFFFKVSVHSLAIWGVIGIIIPLNKVSENGMLFIPTIVLLVIAGLIMSSRLYLQVHTTREVLVGTLVGFMTSFVGMVLLF